MNANNIYTRKIKYLDNGVWRLMIGTMILSLGLLSFLWASSRKCIPFSFKISPSTDSIYYIGQPLSFEASTKKRNISWDFGDSTNEASEGFIAFHTYTRAGNYHVRAIIESGCDTEQVIKVIDSLELNAEAIKGNGYTIPGKEEIYTCTKEFKTIKWQVIGYPGLKPVNPGKTASFHFPQPGTYTIQATLDDDRTKNFIKGVTVNGNTPSPKPSPIDIKQLVNPGPGPKIKEDPIQERVINSISTTTFKGKLLGVLNDAAELDATLARMASAYHAKHGHQRSGYVTDPSQSPLHRDLAQLVEMVMAASRRRPGSPAAKVAAMAVTFEKIPEAWPGARLGLIDLLDRMTDMLEAKLVASLWPSLLRLRMAP